MAARVDELDQFYQNIRSIAESLEVGTEDYELEDATRSKDLCYKVFRTSEDIANYLSGYKINPIYDSGNAQRRCREFSDYMEDASGKGGFNFDKTHLMMFSSLYNTLVDYLDLEHSSLNWDAEEDPFLNMTSRGHSNLESMEYNILDLVENISNKLEEQNP